MLYTPFFSIITVCYNSERTISDTIKSVLNQTYKNYEYLIIDGGSTDKTLEIIKKYETKFNGKLRWISEDDKGIYDAMNKGIDLANGELIGIINSDDWYNYEALEIIINNYNKYIDIYYGNIFRVREIEKKLYVKKVNGNKLNLIKKKMSIPHPSCFVNRRWYEKIKFDTKYKINADYKFILESYIKKARFKYVDFPISFMRIGGLSSISFKNNFIDSMKFKFVILGRKYYFSVLINFLINLLIRYFYEIRRKIAKLFLSKKYINILKTRNGWKPFNNYHDEIF